MSHRQLVSAVCTAAKGTGVGPVGLNDPERSSVAVLDVMLPGLDGLEVYRRLRELGPVAVIMLAALDTEQVPGLELDGDDATKAVEPRELLVRVHSLLRGSGGSPDFATLHQRMLRIGDIELDVIGHRAQRCGRPLQLTGREFDLLAFFLANPGHAFTRAELLQNVWGWSFGDQSTVTVHVRRLREKIEADPANPTLLATVRGVGYRLDPPAEDPVALPRQRMPYGAPPRLPEPEPTPVAATVAETASDLANPMPMGVKQLSCLADARGGGRGHRRHLPTGSAA